LYSLLSCLFLPQTPPSLSLSSAFLFFSSFFCAGVESNIYRAKRSGGVPIAANGERGLPALPIFERGLRCVCL
jgi:hypothetical protein